MYIGRYLFSKQRMFGAYNIQCDGTRPILFINHFFFLFDLRTPSMIGRLNEALFLNGQVEVRFDEKNLYEMQNGVFTEIKLHQARRKDYNLRVRLKEKVLLTLATEHIQFLIGKSLAHNQDTVRVIQSLMMMTIIK